jgi:plastocyanin
VDQPPGARVVAQRARLGSAVAAASAVTGVTLRAVRVTPPVAGARMLTGMSPPRLRAPAPSSLAARAREGRRAPALVAAGLLLSLAADAALGGEIAVRVLDRGGRAVDAAVVTVASVHGAPAPRRAAPPPAIMDQRDRAFVPRVLVVGVGTSVEFPNNDSVSHQVYSFSAAKTFQLPLYKGTRHPPVLFDHEGLVVLGCNIHDQMTGYIVVTAAPFFGMTDAAGSYRAGSVPEGDYDVTLWSPLIADPAATLTRRVHVAATGATEVSVQLAQALRARPEPRPRRGDWEY